MLSSVLFVAVYFSRALHPPLHPKLGVVVGEASLGWARRIVHGLWGGGVVLPPSVSLLTGSPAWSAATEEQ